jgi:WD40 repeat protein/beta-lactamase regulating signal transducer with metallopeptidase domain
MDLLLHIGLSNAVAGFVLAIAAYAICRWRHRPVWAHWLWLVVLLKLVTPPLIPVPLPPLWPTEPSMTKPTSTRGESTVQGVGSNGSWAYPPDEWRHDTRAPEANLRDLPTNEPPLVGQVGDASSATASTMTDTSPPPFTPTIADAAAEDNPAVVELHDPDFAWTVMTIQHAGDLLGGVWMLGSVIVLICVVGRIRRFARVVRLSSTAPDDLQARVSALWTLIGSGPAPGVRLVAGVVSPMLWPLGRRATILLPKSLLAQLSTDELDTLILHELAHYRRRDHWVRLLEVMATVLYWWFPVAWWARREIHIVEEECCDAWVVQTLPAARRAYANALMQTIDFLATRRPSALSPLASGIAPFGLLKRRVTQIMKVAPATQLSWPARVFTAGVSLVALSLFPAVGSETPVGVEPPIEMAAAATDPPSANSASNDTASATAAGSDSQSADDGAQAASARLLQTIVAQGIGRRFPPAADALLLENRLIPLNDAPGPMMALALSPDGTLVATGCGHGSGPGEIVLWDRRTGRERWVHRHALGVRSVAFSPDGRRLATGHHGGYAQVIDVASGKVLHDFSEHTAAVYEIALTPDGGRLVTGSEDRTIKVWNLETGKAERTLHGHEAGIITVAVSPDGARLASSGEDRTIRLWNLETGQVQHVLAGHDELVNMVRFSPDGKRLASASFDGTIRFWDADAGQHLQTLQSGQSRVVSVAFSPDGRRLATGHYTGAIVNWNADTGRQEATINRAHMAPVFGLVFAGNSRDLVSSGFDGLAKIWNADRQLVQTFERRRPPNAEPQPTLAAAWSPDEQFIATAHPSGLVRLTRTETGEVAHRLDRAHDPVQSLAFSPDDSGLVLACKSGEILVWTPNSDDAQPQTFDRHSVQVSHLAFAPNGRFLAAASDDGTVRVWNWKSREPVARFDSGPNRATALAFSPDGELLAAGQTDGRLRLWDLGTVTERGPQAGHAQEIIAVAFSPDGRRLATADRQSVRFWDTTDLKQGIQPLPGATLAGFESPLTAFAFAPRSRGLLVGEAGGRLSVWDPDAGNRIAQLPAQPASIDVIAVAPHSERVLTTAGETAGLWHPLPDKDRIRPLAAVLAHAKGARSVELSPDGRTLVTDGYDARIRIWDVTDGDLLRTIGDGDVATACRLSPDGKLLAVSDSSRRIELQDLETGKTVHRFDGLPAGADVLAFSPDGTHLAALCRNDRVRVYDLTGDSADPVVTLAVPDLPLTDVVFAPDSRSFVTCNGDFQRREQPGQVELWSRDTGDLIRSFGPHPSEVKCAAFNQNGTLLATGCTDRHLRIWDVATGRRVATLRHNSTIFSARFLPDSDLVLTATYDGALWLWNWKSQDRLTRLQAHADFIGRFDLSGDLSVLATASRDQFVKLWALAGQGNELRIVDGREVMSDE